MSADVPEDHCTHEEELQQKKLLLLREASGSCVQSRSHESLLFQFHRTQYMYM